MISMKVSAASILAGLVRLAVADTAQALCAAASGGEEIAGNWYCQAVEQVVYDQVGASGSYEVVTYMDPETGECQKDSSQEFSGPLAPFNEPLSIHMRGPIALKQVAVYVWNTNSKRHNSGCQKNYFKREESAVNPKRRRGEWVTAVINSKTVSWLNTYSAPGPETTPQPSPAATSATKEASSSMSSTPSPSRPSPPSSTDGEYVRISYYNASSGIADGLTFLANYGGQGSGTWSYGFGSSLSYVNAYGTGGSSDSTVLADTIIPSGNEMAIMTDQPCDSGCGYIQPGAVAYKGFPGASKAFLFEFQMPSSSLPDMPALWLLNARIPYTQQYGACSCFATGCGELDVLEVLSPSGTRCKSTFHAAYAGGDSNYFARPLDAPVRVAVVFDGSSGSVSITVLGADNAQGLGVGDFPTTLSASQVRGVVDGPVGISSVFSSSLFGVS